MPQAYILLQTMGCLKKTKWRLVDRLLSFNIQALVVFISLKRRLIFYCKMIVEDIVRFLLKESALPNYYFVLQTARSTLLQKEKKIAYQAKQCSLSDLQLFTIAF